jgi:GT2 family glycosyltransferase
MYARRGKATGADFEERLISAVIVNYEGGELLLDCIHSLLGQWSPLQVIVVDNGSTDGSTLTAAAQFPGIEVVRPGSNLGFAGGANEGAMHARGEFLLLLNPDVLLAPGCVRNLLGAMEDPQVGVSGPVLEVRASNSVERGGTIDPFGYPVILSDRGVPLYVPGCVLATRTSIFEQLGGLDDRFFMFVEDVDYCWRVLLSGWDIRVVDEATAFHVGGAAAPGGYLTARGLETTRFRVALRERNTLAMLLKCYGFLAAVFFVPLYVLQTLLTAALLILAGKFRTSGDIVAGLVWNLRQLRLTLALRRRIRARRRIPDRIVLQRMYRGFRKAELLLRHGLPKVAEGGA